MVLYKMNCPVHIEKTLIVKKNELIRIPKKDGTGAIDVPLFYCNECNRYYHYSARKEYHLMKSSKAYKNIPIYYSNIKYVLGREGENVSLAQQMLKGLRRKGNNSGAGRTFVDSEPRVVKKSSATQSIPKNASNKTTKAVKLHIIDQKSIDPTVRIHVLGKLEIEGKLTANYNSIRKAYPGIATDQMDINSFIRKVFPSGIMQSVVVRNESFKNNSGFLIRSVEIFNKNSSYLNRFLPENCYLSFGGKVIRGEFVIQEIRIWENPLLNDEDIEADLIFAYDGPNHSNWLYSVTEKEIKKSENIEGELADWNAYLDWKRQLAELRIRGVKYIGFKINTEEREITCKRYVAAINLVGRSDFEVVMNANDIGDLLILAGTEESIGDEKVDNYSIQRILKWFQTQECISIEVRSNTELIYLPVLDSHSSVQPLALYTRLSLDPCYFCGMLELFYKKSSEDKHKSETSKGLNERLFEILFNYKVTPGVDWNGKFDETCFKSWMNYVKTWSEENDRYVVAMNTVGSGLSYAQLDSEKLPNKVIIEELNRIENNELRRGYYLGVINQRGVHFIDPEGKPELELAHDFNKRASVAENKGYSRYAGILRKIAERYTREAKQNIKEAGVFKNEYT